MGISCHICWFRTPQISVTTSPVDIIDDGDIVDDRGIMDIPDVIVAYVDAIDMFSGAKGPIVGWGPVTAERDADIYPRSHRRPAIITSGFAPGHPGWRPLISRSPHPAIGVIVKPVAIMKGSPAPFVARYPCPAFIGVDPISIGPIRAKVAARSGNPYISIIRVVHPIAIRAQLVIKDLEADVGLCISCYLPYTGEKAC